MTNEVYLVIDESGAKGFADNAEHYGGELGMMAGYFIHSKNIERTRKDLEDIRNRFSVKSEMKKHLTVDREQRHAGPNKARPGGRIGEHQGNAGIVEQIWHRSLTLQYG